MNRFIARTATYATCAFGCVTLAWSAQAAEATEHLWFTDNQVSVYYAVDPVQHQLVLVTEPATGASGRSTRTVQTLRDGERVAVAQAGQGRNALAAVLTATRTGPQVSVNVQTALQP